MMDVLAEERHEGRHQAVDYFQTLVQRVVSRLFVLPARGLPEAASVASDIPVAQLINESLDG
jgi:hypothetical protein